MIHNKHAKLGGRAIKELEGEATPFPSAWPHLPELLDLLRSDASLDVPGLLLSGRGYGLLVHTHKSLTLECRLPIHAEQNFPLEGLLVSIWLLEIQCPVNQIWSDIESDSRQRLRPRVAWQECGTGVWGSQLCKSIPAVAGLQCATDKPCRPPAPLDHSLSYTSSWCLDG